MKWKNIDFIRSLEVDEMADFLFEHFNCPPEGNCPIEEECDGSNCTEHIKKWLQEVRK